MLGRQSPRIVDLQDGTFLIAGGFLDSGDGQLEFLRSVEIYDSEQDAFFESEQYPR